MKLENCSNQQPEAVSPVQVLSATIGTVQVQKKVSVLCFHLFLCISLDYEHCPCKNWDEDNQVFCEKDDFEEFYPDFTDCASHLNCSYGCIETVLVWNSTFNSKRKLRFLAVSGRSLI